MDSFGSDSEGDDGENSHGHGHDMLKTNMFRFRATKEQTLKRGMTSKEKDIKIRERVVKDDKETKKESKNIMNLLKANTKSTNILKTAT